jgi:hypothetical protein
LIGADELSIKRFQNYMPGMALWAASIDQALVCVENLTEFCGKKLGCVLLGLCDHDFTPQRVLVSLPTYSFNPFSYLYFKAIAKGFGRFGGVEMAII